MNLKNKMMLLVMILGFSLAGCGGGDNPGGGAVTISGVAAAGAPVSGIVNVKGANGEVASSPINTDGTYSLDVSSLTPPYILFAEGTVNGKGIKIYSVGVSAGTINITPVTDFILRNAIGRSVETAFNSWGTTQVSEAALSTAETDVQTQLTPLLNAMGVPSDTDLLTTPFQADHSGLDAVLDAIEISYNGNTATIVNNLTGSSYTDDVTVLGDSSGLPAADEAGSQGALTDAQAINAFWKSLEDLFVTAPSSTAITDWVNNRIAEDFLDEGQNKTNLLNDWLSDNDPIIGETFSAVIVAPIDVSATVYTKGYSVRVSFSNNIESGDFLTPMVFDGATWLWFGDRKWLDTGANASAFMSVSGGVVPNTFSTGFELSLEDDFNFAFNKGVRSAVVRGPGLPADGVVYEHRFPDPSFGIFGSFGVFFIISDDALISAIPDNAEYTFTLCSETAIDLANNGTGSCTVLQTYTDTVIKPPLLNSELNASKFASLTNPSTHNLSSLNFGGQISVNWTKPANTNSRQVFFIWSASSTRFSLSVDVEGGGTSAVLDTTDLPVSDGFAGLFVRVGDNFGRDFNMGWSFF